MTFTESKMNSNLGSLLLQMASVSEIANLKGFHLLPSP